MITLDDVRGLEPPAIYDHEPTEKYHVGLYSPKGINQICQAAKKKEMIILGCTIAGHWIFIRNDLPPEVYDVILRHEKAHVNGWKHR